MLTCLTKISAMDLEACTVLITEFQKIFLDNLNNYVPIKKGHYEESLRKAIMHRSQLKTYTFRTNL